MVVKATPGPSNTEEKEKQIVTPKVFVRLSLPFEKLDSECLRSRTLSIMTLHQN